jgi:hypothetical protein
MSNAKYPKLHGLSWQVKKTTNFRNAVQDSVQPGYETRLNFGVDPIYSFEMAYTVLFGAGFNKSGRGKNELGQVEAFFNARKGDYDSFLLDLASITSNPADSSVVGQSLSLDVNHCAPLVRTIGQDSYTYDEAIYELARDDSGALTTPVVKLDGTILVAGTGYTLVTPAQTKAGTLNANGITYGGYVIQLLGPAIAVLTGTSILTADFGWLYRVRFAQSMQEFAMFHALLWEAQQVQLKGTRT